MGFLRKRFAEPSTWAGLGSIIVTVAQAASGDKTAIGATIVGILAMVLPEQKSQ